MSCQPGGDWSRDASLGLVSLQILRINCSLTESANDFVNRFKFVFYSPEKNQNFPLTLSLIAMVIITHKTFLPITVRISSDVYYLHWYIDMLITVSILYMWCHFLFRLAASNQNRVIYPKNCFIEYLKLEFFPLKKKILFVFFLHKISLFFEFSIWEQNLSKKH